MPSSTEMSRDSPPEQRGLHAWLEKLGLGRPELRAWAMYDWANSAMACTIVTAVFPVYYGSVACAGMTRERATQWFSLWTTVAMVLIALISPLLGTIADFNGQKKRMLGGFLALGVASVAAMFFIYKGDWVLASILFILANIGANGSYVFYDALLPHIARDDEVDRVSTAGYALGYIGGGTLLALNLAWILKPEWFGLPAVKDLSPQGTLPSRLAFLSVAVWWLVFSIPLFRHVPEPAAVGGGRAGGLPVRAAIDRLVETGRSLRLYRQAFLMLVAFLIYNDGIGTIMRMATRYGDEIGIGQGIMIGCDRAGAVRRHPVRVPLRHARRADRRQAVDRAGPRGIHGHLHFRVFHEDRHPFSGARGHGRGGAGGNSGAEPLAVRQPDPAGKVGGVFRVLRCRREIRRHLRTGDLRSRQPRERVEPRFDFVDHRFLHRRRVLAGAGRRRRRPAPGACRRGRGLRRNSRDMSAALAHTLTRRCDHCFRQCITLIAHETPR